MCRSVSIAVLAGVVILALGGLSPAQKSFAASAQQKQEAVEVKIDNFSLVQPS